MGGLENLCQKRPTPPHSRQPFPLKGRHDIKAGKNGRIAARMIHKTASKRGLKPPPHFLYPPCTRSSLRVQKPAGLDKFRKTQTQSGLQRKAAAFALSRTSPRLTSAPFLRLLSSAASIKAYSSMVSVTLTGGVPERNISTIANKSTSYPS